MDTSSPSEQGVDPDGISSFLDAVEGHPMIEPHGLIVQRHGRRVAEGHWSPHGPDHARQVYSLSKTFTGTALGLLVGEGRLSLDDPVVDHLPAELADADPRTRRMTIRHLASMATGHDHETYGEALAIDPDDPVRGFFAIPPDQEPGSVFAYNQPPVIALAAILQGLAGGRLTDYLRPRLLEPLGITQFRWAQLRPGLDMGFSGVYTTLDAVARLGQLHLDDGVWAGRRILPEGWVAEVSTRHITNLQREEADSRQGYGLQVWMSQHGYRGDGALGQLMVVLPEHDAVVATFACTEEMQTLLDLMWLHLLPAMGSSVAPASDADRALARRLDGLSLPTVGERRGGGPTPLPTMTFTPAPSERDAKPPVSRLDTEATRLVIREGEEVTVVAVGAVWTPTEPSLAASATRLPDGRFAVDLAFLATPHHLEIELDPSTGTFTTRWSSPPLSGAGVGRSVATMHAPPT